VTFARTRGFASLALLASAGLILAACGGDDDNAATDGESDVDAAALEGVSVTVGSKDFTENILLGEMLAQALAAQGADVTNQINLGGTSVNREALLSGDIDVYPDYNGTGWTVHLGNEDPSSDPQELYDVTAEADLEQNGVQWVGLSPFNDTYGFASNGDLTAENGGPFTADEMFAYVADNPDSVVCMESEFPDRPDGLVLFEEGTGITIPDNQIQILDTGLIYTETANGACDFGEVFTTDGRIEALNIDLVEDPGYSILYNVSYTWDDEHFQENAEAYTEIVESILAPLDNGTMAALNAQVDVDGEAAEDVAAEYLTEQGLL
jgi:osmoprotectant transport system substrate-binding protein